MSKKIVPSFVPDFQADLIDAIEDAKLKGKQIQISMPRQMGRTTVQRILSARPVGPVIVHKSRACGPTRIGKIDGDLDLVGLAAVPATVGRIDPPNLPPWFTEEAQRFILKARQKSDSEASMEDIQLHRMALRTDFVEVVEPTTFKGEDIMAVDQAPPKGGPIPSINHGNTAPGAAGSMDHGTTAAGALAAKKTNTTVPVKIGSYPETGIPGQANKA